MDGIRSRTVAAACVCVQSSSSGVSLYTGRQGLIVGLVIVGFSVVIAIAIRKVVV